jgi:hypothetical protein
MSSFFDRLSTASLVPESQLSGSDDFYTTTTIEYAKQNVSNESSMESKGGVPYDDSDETELETVERSPTTEVLFLHYLSPTIKKLEGFRKLRSNWDSYGADPISQNAISKTRELLIGVQKRYLRYVKDLIVPTEVSPIADGGVQIAWQGTGGEIEVDIGFDKSVGYLLVVNRGQQKKYEEEDGVSDETIYQMIARAFSL